MNKQGKWSKKESELEDEWVKNMKKAVQPHIASFEYAITHGLSNMIKLLPTWKFTQDSSEEEGGKKNAEITVSSIQIAKPEMPEQPGQKLYPSQCREGRLHYSGKCNVAFEVKIIQDEENDENYTYRVNVDAGYVPVMVMSSLCNLRNMSKDELAKHGEEIYEAGGYFILGGTERLLRLLNAPKRNYPFAISRKNVSGKLEKRIFVRSVRKDETMTLNYLKYRSDGSTVLTFQAFEVSTILLLKALKKCTDREIFENILGTYTTSLNIDRVMNSIKQFRERHKSVDSPDEAYAILGSQLGKYKIGDEDPITLARRVVRRFILPFLESDEDKFEYIIFMLRKLFLFVDGKVPEERTEDFAFNEVQGPGQVFITVIRDALISSMQFFANMTKSKKGLLSLDNQASVESSLRVACRSIQTQVQKVLSTGSAFSTEFPSLVQTTALSIIAERINFYRYFAHFRSIHKGTRLQELRTTSFRKLSPEEWGFICPVHTPDGGPCGLLNHLARDVDIIMEDSTDPAFIETLSSLGMSPVSKEIGVFSIPMAERSPVFLNGTIVGYIRANHIEPIANQLRYMKVKKMGNISSTLEIVPFAPSKAKISFIPCLFLSTHCHRFSRPVQNLITEAVEQIGPMEQIFLNIACVPDDIKDNTTHIEISASTMLSNIGSLTPFSDFNQSPRNIYQCQMGKQSIGFPLYNFRSRTDNKLYRLNSPQKPLVRTEWQEKLPFNGYTHGTNAVVAVISYTGYDMEDAMIVNKSSYERGFGHASMYKSEAIFTVDLWKEYKPKNGGEFPVYFNNWVADTNKKFVQGLDSDGLPAPGTILKDKTPMYCVYNESTCKHEVHYYKGAEEAIVDNVKVANVRSYDHQAIFTNPNTWRKLQAIITVRINRNPTIGDKFSSRHGQKGIMSMLWPQEDMPFAENGLVPDCIINPHAFPSRMTIGMLIESMAGKAGALHGYYADATPFQFDEDNQPIAYFGEQLKKAGYNYYGNETLYSGTTGVEMKCEIYIGVVYYQRLRHMVSDKFQARNNRGPVDRMTRQPIKGRKKGGGLRFGEMERDALLAYGSSSILRDRMLICSDYEQAQVCRKCGSLFSVIGKIKDATCTSCHGREIGIIEIPYALRYLNAELAAMNIKMKINVKDRKSVV